MLKWLLFASWLWKPQLHRNQPNALHLTVEKCNIGKTPSIIQCRKVKGLLYLWYESHSPWSLKPWSGYLNLAVLHFGVDKRLSKALTFTVWIHFTLNFQFASIENPSLILAQELGLRELRLSWMWVKMIIYLNVTVNGLFLLFFLGLRGNVLIC